MSRITADAERAERQCAACPWRDMETMRSEFPEVVEHATSNLDGFVCHTRCGPCSGPRRALAYSGSSEGGR